MVQPAALGKVRNADSHVLRDHVFYCFVTPLMRKALHGTLEENDALPYQPTREAAD